MKWSEHQDLYVDVYPVPRLDLGKISFGRPNILRAERLPVIFFLLLDLPDVHGLWGPPDAPRRL